jgi:cytidyltransferase-like protein
MKDIVIASGYFNPAHSGHIEYLSASARLGFYLVVIVNNDRQVGLKGSVPFMDTKERMKIVRAIQGVNYVVESVDEDGTVCSTIEKVVDCFKFIYGADSCNFTFAKGGDRTLKNIPEKDVCKKLGVKMTFGVGGGKSQSSSGLIQKAIEGYHNLVKRNHNQHFEA